MINLKVIDGSPQGICGLFLYSIDRQVHEAGHMQNAKFLANCRGGFFPKRSKENRATPILIKKNK